MGPLDPNAVAKLQTELLSGENIVWAGRPNFGILFHSDDLRKTHQFAFENFFGAIEGTRTPTPLPVHGPEPCASANSATMALLNQNAAAVQGRRVRKIDIPILQPCHRLSN